MEAANEEVMRKIIRDTIRGSGVQEKISEAVGGAEEVAAEGDEAGGDGTGLAEDRLMAMLLEHGLVDHVKSLCTTALEAHAQDMLPRSKQPRKRLRRYIDLTIVEGKAFVGQSTGYGQDGAGAPSGGASAGSASASEGFEDDGNSSSSSSSELDAAPSLPAGGAGASSADVFVLHVHFRKQRFVSRPVACAEEPIFNETFPLELPKDFRSIASLSDPVHLVLCRVSGATGASTPIGSHMLAWQRMVLGGSDLKPLLKTVEMDGVGAAATMPAGALSVRVGLRPSLPDDTSALVLSLDAARSATVQQDNLFLAHAKQWWQDYLSIRSSHASRVVKMFASDEAGRSRLACKTVMPLPSGRHLDTPKHAARFVALLPHRKTVAVGMGGSGSSSASGSQHGIDEQWANLHTILCSGGGGVQDHAVLLCSLLLGFGADAYVCIGTRAGARGAAAVAEGGSGAPAAHVWVMTFGHGGTVTFWESTTGEQWVHSRWDKPTDTTGLTERTHRYRTIGCAFNSTSFYANIQASDKLGSCSMDLANEYCWKALSSDAISTISPLAGSQAPPLAPNKADVHLLAEALEADLHVLLGEHREQFGLGVMLDDRLSQVLNPFLAAYELEKANGVAANNEEHQHNVRMAIPKGHTFKAFPIEFSHCNAARIMAACKKDPSCAEILDARGDHVVHGIRARVFAYPENTFAVWVMVAVTFRSVV